VAGVAPLISIPLDRGGDVNRNNQVGDDANSIRPRLHDGRGSTFRLHRKNPEENDHGQQHFSEPRQTTNLVF
jgi:hypothetical protein